MIGVEKEPRYDLVDPLVFDNGHDSDDTLYSEGRNARSKSTRKPTQRTNCQHRNQSKRTRIFHGVQTAAQHRCQSDKAWIFHGVSPYTSRI